MEEKFVKNKHYYMDDTRVVFTAFYHIERGYCCGSKCRHCPYEPQYVKGNTYLKSTDSEDQPLHLANK